MTMPIVALVIFVPLLAIVWSKFGTAWGIVLTVGALLFLILPWRALIH